MSITERLILPVDVGLTPVAELSPSVRTRLKASGGEYALSRPRGRANAKLVSAEGAQLLAEFREGKLVAEAVTSYAARRALDADGVLREAFPLLRDCFNDRFLVPVSSPDAAAILPSRERGDRLGPFEVLELLQLRDDTELYQARSRDGALVALKLVRPGRAREAGPILAREAATLRRLAGVAVPKLIARGLHRKRPWLAVSWCVGVSSRIAFTELRERAAVSGRAPLLELALRITRAYARLHRRGVLHGDVHPENVLIGRRGEVTIVDFGLATPIPPLRLGGQAARGAMAPYFTPEHAAALLHGRHPPAPTPQSEVHAVGSLVYALVTGAPYADFELERDAMLRQVLSEPPLPFARRGLAPWPELEAVLRRALAKQPEERPATMAALVAALRRVPRPTALRVTSSSDAARDQLLQNFLSAARETGVAELPPPTGSVMLGAAGVAYALYRLACQRDDPEALALADVWLARVEADCSADTVFSAPGTELVPDRLGRASPFHTLSGVQLVRALIALALGEPVAAETAITAFVASSRHPCDTLDLTLGRSATLLGCSLLLEAVGTTLERSAGALRALGKAALDELWQRVDHSEISSSGIAHGWGGILYATLRWMRAAGAEPPARLQDRLEQLAAAGEPRGRGVRWPYPDGGEGSTGWCNGPAGLIHLWTLAHERYKQPEFRELACACGWSAWEARGRLPNLCCGLAGRAYGLLQLYQYSGAPEWRQRAEVLADRAIEASRHNPQLRERPLSLFKGMPGIVLLAADLRFPEHAAMPFFAREGWPPMTPAGHG